MDWVLLSILATFSVAVFQLINQYVKADGLLLAVWMKAFLAVLVLPILLIVGFPQNPLFYIYVIATLPFAMLGDKISFDIAAQYGGGVLSRVMPLHLVLIFFIWLIINPSLFFTYSENKWVGLGLILSLSAVIYCAMQMRHCTVSFEAFKKSIPVLICFGIVPIFSKLSLDNSGFHQGVFGYMFVQGLGTAIIGFPYLFFQKRKSVNPIFNQSVLIGAIICSLAVAIHLTTKNYAYTIVDDPTFPTAIMMTSPLFILLFYKLVGYQEKANIWAGIGVVISVIILTVLKGG